MTGQFNDSITGTIAVLREREVKLISNIAESLLQLDDADADALRLRDIARDLRDMFFLVAVIGEFNAGKSSVVNALIGEQLLPTGIKPTTEYIELIRYAPDARRKPAPSKNGLREWAHPNIGADGVALVDTPGTGSVFQQHEKTATDFLHRSDLVIFVLSAKRAFAESERLYLELARNYGKKIILVINQVDLLSKAEAIEVRKFVEDRVTDLLDIRPLIFMTSSKDYFEKPEAETTSENSGIAALRLHLRGVYQQAPPAKQKLLTQLATAERICQDRHQSLQSKLRSISKDSDRTHDIEAEIDQQSMALDRQMAESKAEIMKALESMRQRGMAFLSEHMSVRKMRRLSRAEELQRQFQDVVVGSSLRDINSACNDYVNAVIDQSRIYWRSVIERLNQIQQLLEAEVDGLDAGIYSEQRVSLQDAIRLAESEFESYSSGKFVFELQETFNRNMSGFQRSALGSVSGIVAAVLAVLTPGPLIGAAAAPLALPVFVLGVAGGLVLGIPAWRYFRKVSRETRAAFNKHIDTLAQNYETALEELTSTERNRLQQYGKQILSPIFSRLDVLAKRHGDHEQQFAEYLEEVEDMRGRIQAIGK